MKLFNILLVTISLLISNVSLKAQNSFSIIISNPDDQVINQVVENIGGGFVLVGRIYHYETGLPSGYIIEIDSSGKTLQENIIQHDSTKSYILFNIHFYNDHYYILGSQESMSNPDTSKLLYMQLNSDLEIENEKLLDIPINRWVSYMNSIIDSDSNFVITGYTTRLDTNQNGNTIYNDDVYFYKLNLNGDSLTSHFYTSWVPIDCSFDLLESRDSSKYYAFVSHFTEAFGTSGQRLILDKNLDSLNIDSIPLGIFDNYSPTYLDQNEILLCGKRLDENAPYALHVLSMTETGTPIDYGNFKKDPYRDFPSMYQGISKYHNNIYVGGTSNFDYSNPFFSTLDSWYHLIKINPDISPIWENWYGGDAYYQLYSILATKDGGCLIVGNRYDYEIQNQERDIYVAKVDSAGLIVWVQEIQPDKPLFTIFPNPSENQINIRITKGEFDFELINPNGQVLINQQVQSQVNTINVESLKSGLYFYRVTDHENNSIQTGKWIKK
jgi:hypothetical protein